MTIHQPPLRAMALVLAISASSACSAGECRECQEEKCSDLVRVCADDPDCGCVADCVADEGLGEVDACLGRCGVSERPTSFHAVEECMTLTCPDRDECAAPGPYVPPESPDSGEPSSMMNIGAGDLPDCSFDAGLAWQPDGEILQLTSADQSVCVRIDRRNDGPGSLANTQWTLLDMRVGPLGEVAHIEDPDSLCWYSSHHNFTDWGHAWAGTRHYDVKLVEDGHGGPRTYELNVFEQGPLEAGGCAPIADGSLHIGPVIELHPFMP